MCHTENDKSGDNELRLEINRKWRSNLFNICVVLAAIGSAAEIVIYLIDSHIRNLFLPPLEYRFRFIYIPSSMNIIVIVLTYFHLKSPKLSDRTKNIWSCILIYFLCANTQVIHYVYGPLLMLPVIAIFFSVIFGDRALTRAITLASLGSLAIAGRMASIELRKGDPQLVSDLGLAVLVILVAHIGATLMDAYTVDQNRSIIAGKKRQDQLIEELRIDPLMGIFNRMALNERIDECIKQASHGETYCLIMFDIDDFKKINDTYGHLRGDAVLVSLAEIIRHNESSGCSAYRYGGEEIVLIFRDTDEKDAYDIGEKIRMEFSRTRFDRIEGKTITISGGIAELKNGETGAEWVQDADDAMYKAKDQGKNRIVRS